MKAAIFSQVDGMPAPPRRPLSRRRAASRQTDRPTDSSSSSLYAAMITIMRKPRARSLHGVRCCVRMGRLTDERREDGRRARAVPPRHPQVEPRPNSAVQGMRLCDGRRASSCLQIINPAPAAAAAAAAAASAAGAEGTLPASRTYRQRRLVADFSRAPSSIF